MLLTSTGFKTQIIGPQAFEQIFNGGSIHVYTGARLSSADAAAPESNRLGIVGLSGSNGALSFARVGAYAMIPAANWWQLAVEVSGTATWFRLLAAGDGGDASTSAPRIDGDIGIASAPAEMVLTSTTLTAGTAVSIDSFVFTLTP